MLRYYSDIIVQYYEDSFVADTLWLVLRGMREPQVLDNHVFLFKQTYRLDIKTESVQITKIF